MQIVSQSRSVHAIWEGITQETRYTPQPSVVDPDLISDAFAKLALFPPVMCNNLHLQSIKNFLMKGGKNLRDYTKSLGGIAGLLAPAAMAINPAVGTGLQMASAGMGGINQALNRLL